MINSTLLRLASISIMMVITHPFISGSVSGSTLPITMAELNPDGLSLLSALKHLGNSFSSSVEKGAVLRDWMTLHQPKHNENQGTEMARMVSIMGVVQKAVCVDAPVDEVRALQA